MEATVSYLLMLQKCINWKHKSILLRIKIKCNTFSVDFNQVDNNDILDIHQYWMKQTTKKQFLG